jgi:maltokinase
VVRAIPLGADDPPCWHLVVEVPAGDDAVGGRYQVLVGLREQVPERLHHVMLGPIGGDYFAYDALHDPELAGRLLDLTAEGAEVDGIRFTPETSLQTGLAARVLVGEQSNTSVIFGDQYMMKVFRRLATGLNPDLEIHRALASVGCQHIAQPEGAIEGELDGGPVTYAILSEYLATGADGWSMAAASVRDLLAEGDLRADEVGGDFAAEAHRLGQAVAAVHADLAKALGAATAPDSYPAATARLLVDRLDAAVEVVPKLAEYAPALRELYAGVADLVNSDRPVTLQRIHGDLHLGQVMRTEVGWILLDFEGEPARPLADRIAADSPLRDVAGMLRSFDYAARHLLAGFPGNGSAAHHAQLEFRANEWAERNRDAFCAGYADITGSDPCADTLLLRAFELDKAIYECVYEARHRPTWLRIPLNAVARLLTPLS